MGGVGRSVGLKPILFYPASDQALHFLTPMQQFQTCQKIIMCTYMFCIDFSADMVRGSNF